MQLSDLQQAVQHIYSTAVYPAAFTATTDSQGNATIATWNASFGAEPTADQLTSALASVQLTSAKAAQSTIISRSYAAARYNTPVSVTVSVGQVSFPVDTLTQSNVVGYVVAFAVPGSSAPPSAGLPLLDASGTVRLLTVADVQIVAGAIANQSITAWTTYNNLLAQIAAATTVAEVQAVVWPSNVA